MSQGNTNSSGDRRRKFPPTILLLSVNNSHMRVFSQDKLTWIYNWRSYHPLLLIRENSLWTFTTKFQNVLNKTVLPRNSNLGIHVKWNFFSFELEHWNIHSIKKRFRFFGNSFIFKISLYFWRPNSNQNGTNLNQLCGL
jgi:hypothetical protein